MPKINKIERLNLIKEKAVLKGGICFSNIYINNFSSLNFSCKNKHSFISTGDRIMREHWCSKCSGNTKLTIEEINKQIFCKNIKCISTIYIGNKFPLEWQCLICNCIFIKSKNFIDRDFTKCGGCKKDAALKLAKKAAFDRGGIVLSDKYEGSTKKLTCICKNNHKFFIKYSNLVNLGHWCAICSQNNNISEEICRAYMEALFNEKFPRIRPNWLVGNHGRNLELDGYCEKLNIAFEHQGVHHYQEKFNLDRLENTINNDNIKFIKCKNLGIKLIIIPQVFNKTPLSKLRKFIIDKCNDLEINIFNEFANINLENCYKNSKNDVFVEYKNIAVSKGGKCLSAEYYGCANEKLIWECKNKHQWYQFPYVIKKGNWCPVCSGQFHSNNIIKGSK